MNMSIVPWGQSDLLPCVCVHWKITHPIRFPRNPEKNPSQVPKSHKILLPPKSAPKSREIPLNPHQLLKLCSGNPWCYPRLRLLQKMGQQRVQSHTPSGNERKDTAESERKNTWKCVKVWRQHVYRCMSHMWYMCIYSIYIYLFIS